MKRLVLLLTLVGILSIPFEGFAKPPKQTSATIKYKNGDKYVGEITKYPIKYMRLPIPILPIRFVVKNNKIRNGQGVMYYANGDSFDGSWNNDSPSYGTYQYANGDCFKGSLENNYPFEGQLIFAHNGSIKLGDKFWEYPANSSFNGELEGRNPLSGSFDCTLTSTTGDKFTGTIISAELDKGIILFANGDTFKGSFILSAPSLGEYRYANTTKIAGSAYKWIVPAGCTFSGDIQAFSGTVDMEVTNASGDRFTGSFINGRPNEGTMIFANGTTEIGQWHNSMSPSRYKAYLAKQEAERKRQEAEQKKQEAIYAQQCLKKYEAYVKKELDQNSYVRFDCNYKNKDVFHGLIAKLKQVFIGKTLVNTKETLECKNIEYNTSGNCIEITVHTQTKKQEKRYIHSVKAAKKPLMDIGKTPYPKDLSYIYYEIKIARELEPNPNLFFDFDSDNFYLYREKEQAITRARNYWIQKYGNYFGQAIANGNIQIGMTIEMVQAIKGKGNISKHVAYNGEITVLTYSSGGYVPLFEIYIPPKTETYTFVNGKLTEYSAY